MLNEFFYKITALVTKLGDMKVKRYGNKKSTGDKLLNQSLNIHEEGITVFNYCSNKMVGRQKEGRGRVCLVILI
jgi:hypothetical protein